MTGHRNLLLKLRDVELVEVYWGTPEQIGVKTWEDVPSVFLKDGYAAAAIQLFAATPLNPIHDRLALNDFVAVSSKAKKYFDIVVAQAAIEFRSVELVIQLQRLNIAIHEAEATVVRKSNASKGATKRNKGIPTTEELKAVYMRQMDYYRGYPDTLKRDEFWRHFQNLYEDMWPYDSHKHAHLPIKVITAKCKIGSWRREWDEVSGLIVKE